MALEQVRLGTPPSGSDGDDPRTAFTRINNNSKFLDDSGATGPVSIAREVSNYNDAVQPGRWIGTATATNRPPGFGRSNFVVSSGHDGSITQSAVDIVSGQSASRSFNPSTTAWVAWVPEGFVGALPISRGGTGGTTQVEARAGLGLVLTSSSTDNTPNRVLKTGDFGWGGTSTILTGAQLNALNHTVSGFYGITGAEASTIGIVPSYGGTVTHQGRPGETATQTYRSTGTTDNQIQERSWSSGGGWTPWRRVYHQGNIVGTVSQSGGLPTGAIIERGSNANGAYEKYAGGLMVCYSPSLSMPAITEATGALFAAISEGVAWSFPAVFAVAPTVTGQDASYNIWVVPGAASTTSCRMKSYFTSSLAGARTVSAVAVGRWFV